MANTVLATGYPKLARNSEDAYGYRHRAYTFDFNPSSTYGTGGGILVSPNLFGVSLLDQIENVILSDWSSGGPSGYVFYWNAATGAIQFFETAGQTASGTVAAPTINLAAGAGGNVNVATPNSNNSALANGTAGGALTGLTGVQAPAFTGSASSAAALVEIGNVSVSSVIVRGTFLIRP